MSNDTRDKWPTPGPSDPIPSWEEYNQLKEAIHNYLDHEPKDPSFHDIWRAFGAILGEHQRDAFVNGYNLDAPAERACIARLITGNATCPHSPLEKSDGPPHSPPASDHATLWLDDGEPALYEMHVYPANIERLDSKDPPHNLWFDVFGFAKHYGLEISIDPRSWYNLGRTVCVVFYPPERYR